MDYIKQCDPSSVTAYINDARSLISHVLVCKVKHTLRDGNRAAHQVGKEAFDREESLLGWRRLWQRYLRFEWRIDDRLTH